MTAVAHSTRRAPRLHVLTDAERRRGQVAGGPAFAAKCLQADREVAERAVERMRRAMDALHPRRSRQAITEDDLMTGYASLPQHAPDEPTRAANTASEGTP